MNETLIIRKASAGDTEEIWNIFKEVIAEGNAFTSNESVTRDKFVTMWINDNTFVAELENKIAGAYNIFPVNGGRGSHVCCGAFMVGKSYRRNGIGEALGRHSLEYAIGKKYKAMQFNTIVSTNKSAIRLWKKLGFKIIGKIPAAFVHKDFGLVDTLIMHRFI